MPDVGVLNLQIHDNSEQAATGLENLVGALTRIKSTVSGARIGTVANQIKKIAEVVDNNISTSTISKLNEFCSALSKLQGISNVNIRFNQSGGIKEIRDTVNNTKISVDGINSGFDYVGRRVAEVNETMRDFYNSVRSTFELMQDKSWTGGFEQFQQLLNGWLRMRSAMALGPGTAMSVVPEETGWTYWKDGAIEVEGTVSDATSEINGYLEGTQQLLYGTVETVNQVRDATGEAVNEEEEYAKWFNQVCESMREQAEEAERIRKAQEDAFYGPSRRAYDIGETNAMADNITQLDLLKAKLRDAEIAYNRFVNTLGAADTKTIKAGLAVSNLRDKIWEYENALAEANSESNVENLVPETKAAETETNRLTSALQRLKSAFNSLKTHAKGIGSELGNLKGTMSRMFPTISGLIKRFSQIAKYRMLRAILKQITEGFREGVENVYHYSKAVGTDFAPTMDAAASSLLQMKNSIGAAAAPLIQALVPALQTVVSWVITAMNYVNQFLSLLTGQSEWTQAIPATAEAFEDTAKNAGAAGKKIKEAKNLLAGWDELNIIQQEPSDSSGGVGGSAKKAAKEYKNMFQQVKSFDEGVKRVVDFIEDHLGGIWGLIAKIGAAILGWKISKAFDGVLGRIGKLIAGGALLVLGVELSYGAGYEAGKKGYFDAADILTTLGGWLSSALGGYLIGTSIAGPAGGVYGAVIGLTIGIAATLVGWIAGKERGRRESMWGNLTKTREEIEKDVKGQFTFDVEAEINVMKAQVAKQAEARRNVRIAFNQFAASVQNLKIGIDVGIDMNKKDELVNQAYADYLTLCSELQTMITNKQEGVDLLVQTFKFTDSQGNDITESTLESLKFADKTVMDYFNNLGEEMAGWIYKGEQSGWKNGEAEQVLALMQSQRNIVAKAEKARLEQEKATKVRTGLFGVMSLETAEETFNVQKQYMKEWEDEAKRLVDAEIADNAYMAELAHGAWEDAVAEYGKDSVQAKELKNAENQYLAYIAKMSNEDEYRAAIRARLEPTRKIMAEEWASTLRTVFGEQIDFNVDLLNANNLHFTQLFDGRTTQEAGLQFRKYIEDQVGKIDPLLKEIMTEFGIDTWDMIGDEAKKSMIRNLLGFADENQVKEILTYAFGNLSEETQELVHQTAEEMKSLATLGAESGLSGFNEVLDAKKRQKLTVPMQNFAAYGSDVLEMGSYKGFTNVDSFRDWKRNGMPGMEELLRPEAIEYDLEVVTDSSMSEPIDAPAIDQTNFVSSLESMYETTRRYVLGIIRMLNSISGVDTGAYRSFTAGINKINMQGFASGGFVNSGDIVMANENGNFEMMGRMGNQPVVANNQQIVAGISQGVSTANGEVVAAINNLINVVQRQGNRPVQVNIGSSARLGQTCERSIDMWNKQNGR